MQTVDKFLYGILIALGGTMVLMYMALAAKVVFG